jgi:hypothetical protein
MTRKSGRNDPCFCGSGKKYKKCHLLVEQKKPLPFQAIQAKFWEIPKPRLCMHPEANQDNCGKIIKAHTIPRSRALRYILNPVNKVRSFYPFETNRQGKLISKLVGWKEAATFSAFCSKHDGPTFSDLENDEFRGTLWQIFLLGYRAVCWEIYQMLYMLQDDGGLREEVVESAEFDQQDSITESFEAQDEGFKKGLSELKQLKLRMDVALMNRDPSDYISYEILLKGKTCLASTGAISPNHLLNGSVLQELHLAIEKLNTIAFGIMPRPNDELSVAFLWHKDHEKILKYIDDIDRLDDAKLAEYLVQFFFAHCENTYFADDWWGDLLKDQRTVIRKHASNTNPFYDLPVYQFNLGIAPWQVIGRKRS